MIAVKFKYVARRAQRHAAVSLLSAVAALLSPAAHADDPQWRISAGPGVLVLPKYPGAANSDVLPIVDADISYGRLFLNSQHGAGAFFLDTGRVQAGASLWFRRGRDRNDSVRVADLEPIDAAPAAHAFITQNIGSLSLSASVTQTLADDAGVTADGSVAWRFQPYQATRMQIGIRATVGDRRYMRTWFGVEAGLTSVGGFAAVTHEFSPDWTGTAFAACDVLVGDAADSPVVESETMPMIALSMTRHFGRY